jgi:hypothetical protein
MLYFIIKVCAYIHTVTRMAGVKRDHYKSRNAPHDVRPSMAINRRFPYLEEAVQEMFLFNWYRAWRSGEEFDGAGEGKDEYKSAGLFTIYMSFCDQWKYQENTDSTPITFEEFKEFLNSQDEKYIWVTPPKPTKFDIWDPRDSMHKHSQPEKGPHPVIQLKRDKAGINERVGEDVVNAVLKLIT